jgi:hypothetical protein
MTLAAEMNVCRELMFTSFIYIVIDDLIVSCFGWLSSEQVVESVAVNRFMTIV